MCGTPWDQSPDDGTSPLKDGVGHKEHFCPGPEKKGESVRSCKIFVGVIVVIVIVTGGKQRPILLCRLRSKERRKCLIIIAS